MSLLNIFEALCQSHDIQRDLCMRSEETSGASGKRDELFAALKTELQAHAIAEERHFYMPLM